MDLIRDFMIRFNTAKISLAVFEEYQVYTLFVSLCKGEMMIGN